jgi:hypothetical protein
MDLRLATLKTVSFYLLHNVSTLSQCRKLSEVIKSFHFRHVVIPVCRKLQNVWSGYKFRENRNID